jgi:hypothetical protein
LFKLKKGTKDSKEVPSQFSKSKIEGGLIVIDDLKNVVAVKSAMSGATMVFAPMTIIINLVL